ncbi:alpha/beta hydrolase [Streptomyces eurocidicus]|uniref:Alpha/beta hydrolase n=1 Tax=Streptomyces eurocidicus TaxID=66423 RepID=A0A2N8NUK5_STREU|nr:alpha/beta hydrolase [Streptomyces eurocidicus]MBB5120304.1 pimeloyl-ACP methyl ester carboxylesterase [Streptomyces eurocidicus]MBF6056020.1 alpha/beta fold hydrolase [Streptomyces eurocidicus]PNE32438.1 alpha/beta hydrolase [Streptomyces eurocidicus]
MIKRRTFGKALGLGAGGAAAATPAGPAHASAMTGQGATAAGGRGRTAFPSLKKVRAGLLEIGYAETGPAHGPPVICLHGWPYDIHSFVDVAPLLAAEGYRVIVPYLRGHGTTRFLSPRTFRNGQQSALALDIIALMDALGLEKAVLAGFDWGARCADIIAALWPERCKALVSVGGYLVVNLKTNLQPLAPATEHAWWYQYYFSTERGRIAMEDKAKRHDLTRLVWDTVSPTWDFGDATFERTAAAFENPDYAAIVIHNYRWRLSLAEGERRYEPYEKRLAARPVIAVPTVTLDADRDPFTVPGDGTAYRDRFTGPYDHRTLKGIGHNVPQEAPEAFARAVVDADGL